jgi:hypothetical protein
MFTCTGQVRKAGKILLGNVVEKKTTWRQRRRRGNVKRYAKSAG